jgi:hypothetical protein
VNTPKAADFLTPAWLKEVLAGREPRPTPVPPLRPAAGEFWFASGPGGISRLLLLLKVDETRGLARAALVSSELELATDYGLIFASSEIGTEFPILVETDLVMPVWLTQLGPFAGRLPIPLALVQAAAERRDFSPRLAARRGLPLAGPADPRVPVRDQEVDDLWALCGDCVAALEGWDTERRAEQVQDRPG